MGSGQVTAEVNEQWFPLFTLTYFFPNVNGLTFYCIKIKARNFFRQRHWHHSGASDRLCRAPCPWLAHPATGHLVTSVSCRELRSGRRALAIPGGQRHRRRRGSAGKGAWRIRLEGRYGAGRTRIEAAHAVRSSLHEPGGHMFMCLGSQKGHR